MKIVKSIGLKISNMQRCKSYIQLTSQIITILLFIVMCCACSKEPESDLEPTLINVTAITLSQTSVTLSAGESVSLTATITPENATNKTITWSSSNTSVATVSNGKAAVAVGKATITAQIGNVKAECSVTVSPIEVTAITLSQTSVTLSAGESVSLTAIITPENATNKTITWSSSNTSVATVSNGKVTAVAVGKATITAQASNGLSSTCNIEVIRKTPPGGSEGTGEVEW